MVKAMSRQVNGAKCPKCGLEIEKPQREWDMNPKTPNTQALHVKHYHCPSCGKTFRIGEKIPRPTA
jgi:uncharacterized protein with PIN domain